MLGDIKIVKEVAYDDKGVVEFYEAIGLELIKIVIEKLESSNKKSLLFIGRYLASISNHVIINFSILFLARRRTIIIT